MTSQYLQDSATTRKILFGPHEWTERWKSHIFQKLEQCDLCLPWIVINPQLKRKLLANHPWVCLKVGGNTWIVRYRAILGTPKLENQDSYCLTIAGRGRPYQCICFTSSIFYVKAKHHVIPQFSPCKPNGFFPHPDSPCPVQHQPYQLRLCCNRDRFFSVLDFPHMLAQNHLNPCHLHGNS